MPALQRSLPADSSENVSERRCSSAWTAEDDATLRALFKDGRSSREIAIALGNRSRNSVIGRKLRLGLSGGAARAGRPPGQRDSQSARARRALSDKPRKAHNAVIFEFEIHRPPVFATDPHTGPQPYDPSRQPRPACIAWRK